MEEFTPPADSLFPLTVCIVLEPDSLKNNARKDNGTKHKIANFNVLKTDSECCVCT